MTRLTVLAALAALSLSAATPLAWAQGAPPANPNPTQPTEGSGFNNAMTHTELQRLGDYIDRAHMLVGGDPAKAKAAAKEETWKLAGEMSLGCKIADAEQVGRGQSKVDGKTVDVNVYEVACDNGMGYFLVAQGAASPSALSCFAADATHAADIAAGAQSDMYCQLPANKDIKAMAASLMSGAGTDCSVQKLQWFGQSAESRTEYQEIVCADGKGYLLRTAQPGAAAPTLVMSCSDAAKQGLKCRLTDGGPVSQPLTMQTFRDALTAHGVKCESTRSRVIGQENIRKRYVVEFDCPGQPQGLVAFIPVEGNSTPFETIDCATAVARHILCEYTSQ
ncbi:MAG TPA: hypothetical protein VE046_08455 [Steroidobacteraceae bacterium]|nr:hypothetical protein [Steroidobacteraceae bacterium]